MTLLLLGTIMLLVVAACGSDGDDNGADEAAENENETEAPADDESAEDTEVAVPEDDEPTATESEDDTDGSGNGDDEVAESGDDATAEPEGEGEATEPAGEGTPAPDQGTATPGGEEESGTPEATQPGPQQGVFFDLSFEEANELTEFELKEPQEIPESIEFQTIMGLAAQDASEEERSEEAATITIAYTQPAAEETATPDDETTGTPETQQQGLPVELTQSTEMDMTQGLPPEAEQESITIGDREVTRVEIAAQTGDQIIAYMWDENDVYFSLAAILGPDLDESQLEDMVASIPAG